GPGLEAAHDLGRDAQRVPLAQLDDLVIEPGAPRPADDHVGLLLDLVAVADAGAKAGRVAEVADPEVLGAEVLAADAPLDLVDGRRVLELLEVRQCEAGHGRVTLSAWRPPPMSSRCSA